MTGRGDRDLAATPKFVRPLPSRPGPRPQTTPWAPHVQQDQNASQAMQTLLVQRVFGLATVEERPTTVSAPGARAIWLRDDVPPGPRDAFLSNREVGHFHPWDGSLHIALPPELAGEAVKAGWAEVHPVVRAGMAPDHVVMLYGPRDEGEVQVLFELVSAAVARAAGQE